VLKGDDGRAENRIAIIIYSNDVPNVVVRTGDTDPNTGGIFSQLSDPILSSKGALVFLGSLKGGTNNITGKNSTGIWESQNGELRVIALSGAQAQDFSTQPESFFESFNQIAVNDWGGVVFTAAIASYGSKNTQALFASHFSGGLFLSEISGEAVADFGFPGL